MYVKTEIDMLKQRRKSRFHKALFDDELPFKGRKEAPKKTYRRKDKHSKHLWEDASR